MKKYILFFSLILIISFQGFTQIRVACIGNSITEGFGLQNPREEAYPAVLNQILEDKYGEHVYEVKNYGISARTLLLKGDLPWMKEPYFEDVLAYNPQIVTIKLGTNDTKPHNWQYGNEFQQDLEILIDTLLSLPAKPIIFLCYPIPVYENNWGIREEIVAQEIIPIIDSVAQKYNLQIIDLHSNMEQSLYLKDNVHPNKYGSELIAQKIWQKAFKTQKYHRKK